MDDDGQAWGDTNELYERRDIFSRVIFQSIMVFFFLSSSGEPYTRRIYDCPSGVRLSDLTWYTTTDVPRSCALAEFCRNKAGPVNAPRGEKTAHYTPIGNARVDGRFFFFYIYIPSVTRIHRGLIRPHRSSRIYSRARFTRRHYTILWQRQTVGWTRTPTYKTVGDGWSEPYRKQPVSGPKPFVNVGTGTKPKSLFKYSENRNCSFLKQAFKVFFWELQYTMVSKGN